MIVDQGSRLWLWNDSVVSTFSLLVAKAFWENRSGQMTVIYKNHEPTSFKALFPQWGDFDEQHPSKVNQ